MRPKIRWGDVSYSLRLSDGQKLHFNQVSCFYKLHNINNVAEITIRRTKCKSTIMFHNEYLQYVNKMFALNAVVGKNSFTFKAFKCNNKNMLILSAIRILFEPFCTREVKNSVDISEVFLKPLLTSKEKIYKDRLKRFCYYYNNIELVTKYTTDLHIWLPSRTIIKSTKDFKKVKKLSSVNKFFYTDYI